MSHRRGRGGFLTMFLFLCLIWTQLLITESSSGDHELRLFPSRRSSRLPPPLHPQHDLNPQPNVDDLPVESHPHHLHHHHHHHLHHRQHPARLAKVMPAALLDSRFRQEPSGQQTLNLLARPHHEVQPEHAVVSARHLVTVYLAVDVRRLNVSLLRWFREGVAAALGVPAGRVHINRLNEEKNGIELFVSSDGLGISEPRPAEEVIQSLNVRVLHRHLGHFGITEVSTGNVLQGEPRDHVWSREGFYAVVLFFTIFVIIVTCLMVLYRLKEKVQVSDRQVKAPPPDLHLTPTVSPDSAQRSKGTKVVTSGSMVQAELPPAVATPIPQQQPIVACRRLAPPIVPLPSPAHVHVFSSSDHAPQAVVAPVTASNELKPCPSPFRMKPAAGLQERRGSNVSLVLDMSALGSVEPLNVAVVTPREAAAREYLLSAARPLTRQQLRDIVNNTHKLHAEFAEIPMNFIDPKELDIPNHGTKNRYKTILPNPHSRVILKSKNCNDLLSSYINANYIRGYLGDEKAFIATQGPMVNTVNDFWQMAWQEESPVIVMITKLKEKNEKCVLYWPEKRGIYGKVEVLVNSIRECEHYTTRSLTLKCGNQTRVLQHYWYTSWPDHKTPDSTMPLLQLMADVEADRRTAATTGPVIAHCSAGIGRTGCFIATTIGCRQLQLEGVVDVLSITCQLRADRGGMIQTGEQYEFVHHALSLYEARLSAETGQ
ncbi:receptor-type tyrosine-protein phosphatase R isoform X2 [Dicentrarchus labrax]|uniref:receptor-type tyrosine-protein phosphatase R isoform X2 n=1 Tax=Dicentrarchus labrax TaxID=13489 RepID=UPI0021F50024|nr:receptor-type tyrosine-protein phosphatase R isoform X2 [Dicentrarchus labrax]